MKKMKLLALLAALLLALGVCGAYAEAADVQEDAVLASAYNGEISVMFSVRPKLWMVPAFWRSSER